MDFGFDEEQAALAASVRGVIEATYGIAYVRRMLDDRRGFSSEFWSDAARLGCRYELSRLGEHLGAKPIVLLADASTDRGLAAALLGQGRSGALSASSARRAYLLDAPPRAAARLLGVATRLLLGAEPEAPRQAPRAMKPGFSKPGLRYRNGAPSRVITRPPAAASTACPAAVSHSMVRPKRG